MRSSGAHGGAADPVLVVPLNSCRATIARRLQQRQGQPGCHPRPAPARQPQLLAETLAKVKPTPKNRAQLYFVGVAGYGGQAVFKREVLSVRELFDQRFGTAERSMTLINHPSTLRQFPLATISIWSTSC